MMGRLGAFYLGKKQVGGFLDWKLTFNMAEGLKDGDKTFKPQSWRIVAWAHWVSQVLDPGDLVDIKLCDNTGTAYWTGTGKIASTITKNLETLMHIQLEFLGSGPLEGGKVDG